MVATQNRRGNLFKKKESRQRVAALNLLFGREPLHQGKNPQSQDAILRIHTGVLEKTFRYGRLGN